MNNIEKTEKHNLNIPKVIILLMVIAVCFYLLYYVIEFIKKPADLYVVESGKIALEEDKVGVIIRDEIVISGENSVNGLVQIKTEGEKVSKGESVFRYHGQNESELNSKIHELDLKIQEALSGQSLIYSNDVKILEKQIEDNFTLIRDENDISKIREYKKIINNAITKKAQIIGDLSPSGSYIRELINERRDYESELNSNVEYIKAPMSGIVSYRIDGLEEAFNINDFSNLNKNMLNNLNFKVGQIVASNNEKGKIINNFDCYIAIIMNSDIAKEKKVGDVVSLRLFNSIEVKGEIAYIQDEENDRLIVFKINKGVERLINYRKVSVDVIWWSSAGLKVPNTAIRYENNIAYVIKNMSGYEYKIYVKVINKNEIYSIIKNYTIDEYKELGFSEKDIKEMKKITIYDEILSNPDV